MMATNVSLTINFRDGSSQTISQAASENNGTVVRYDKLSRALNYLQEESNAILTTLVNQEKAQKSSKGDIVEDGNSANNSNGEHEVNSVSSTGNIDDDDTDDEDDEDDDDTDKPSAEKRRKT